MNLESRLERLEARYGRSWPDYGPVTPPMRAILAGLTDAQLSLVEGLLTVGPDRAALAAFCGRTEGEIADALATLAATFGFANVPALLAAAQDLQPQWQAM